MDKKKRLLISFSSCVAMVFIWEIVSVALDAPVILPSPFEVASAVLNLLTNPGFLKNVGSTVLRAVLSFLIIFVCGSVTGTAAGLFPAFDAVLSPFLTLLKATPVMSVILLAFIWFSTGTVPVFAAFLMAFPVMYVQVVNGMQRLDTKLVQMCRVYGITGRKYLLNFVIPSLVPSYLTGARQSLSMIWKVVIAAEVLTVPQSGVGRSLQLAQVRLDTASVFAWTIIAVVLTFAGDFVFSLITRRKLSGRYYVEA